MKLEKVDFRAAINSSPGTLANVLGNNNAGDMPDSAFTPVSAWTVPVEHDPGTASFFQRIGLTPPGQKPLSPGLYRMTASVSQPDSNGKIEMTDEIGWARITRLAMITKTYGKVALASVVDLQTGASVPGLDVSLYQIGSSHVLLDNKKGSAQGLAQLSTASADKETEGALIAHDPADGSTTGVVIQMNNPGGQADEGDSDHPSSSANPNAPSLRDFIYTDRPVYRPGQTVNLKGIMRLFAQSTGFTIPANKSVNIHITDAQNTVIADQNLTTNGLGSWNTSVAISPEALTGEYGVHVTMGDDPDDTDDATFDVAAYKKPEYQVKVDFDKPRYIRGDTIQAKISASYFFGSPVLGVKPHVSVYRGDSPDDSESSSHDSDNGNVSGEALIDEDVTLDGLGEATISIPTKDQPQSPSFDGNGDTTYSVEVSLGDGSGNTAQTTGQTTVAQGLFDLDVTSASGFCSPKTPVEVTLTASDAGGKPLVNQHVSLEAVYDEWDGNNEKFTSISKSDVATGSGGVVVTTITPPRAGYLLIRASAIDIRGNKIQSVGTIWVASDNGVDLSARYADLSLVLDKKSYVVGDTANLLINTAHPGASALVTIEGATIYHAYEIPLTHRSTAIQIPVALEYAPGVTISASCIAGKQFLSASAQLTTADPRLPLQISITADRAKYQPGDPCKLTIVTKDAKGQPVPAEISVGVVDSAVYAIEPEDPRKIDDAMEPVQSDGVTTNNSCETIYYGDADKGATDIDIRRKFPDTALWIPDLMTGIDGKVLVQFSIPDSLTTWHVTCLGHTVATQVGKGTADLVVTKDLLARLDAPTFLVEGDRSTLTGIFHNNTASTVDATVHLIPTGLTVDGTVSPTFSLQPGTPVQQKWSISVHSSVADPAVTVRAGALSDGIAEPISIVPHGTTESDWHSGVLSLYNLKAQNYTQRVRLAPDAIRQSSDLRIRVAPTIASSIIPALNYLAAYPYGTSYEVSDTLAADAIVSKAAAVNGGPVAVPVAPSMRARLKDMTTRAILRLYRLQSGVGGWGWFAQDDSSPYMTAYAMWSLALAKDAGFSLNQDIVDSGTTQLIALMNTERLRKYPDVDTLAVGCLALAKLGQKSSLMNSLRYVRRRIDNPYAYKDNATRAMYILAEQQIGGAEEANAQSEMAKLWGVSRQTGDLYSWTSEFHRRQAGATEDSPDAESTAWVFMAAEAVSPNDPRLAGIARWLMMNRNDDHWGACTCATMATVIALTGYLAQSHELQPDFNVMVSVGGKPVITKHYTSADVMSPDETVDVPATEIPAGGADVVVSAKGVGRCYYTTDVRTCTPVELVKQPSWISTMLKRLLEPANSTATARGPTPFQVKRVYLRTTSRRNFLMEDTVPKPDTSFNSGEDMVVRLIIDSTQPGARMIVDEPVPAGCKITELSGDAYADWSNWWDYTDVRDDRVVFYISDLPRGRHEIDYHLHASIPGAYDIMPCQLSSEADPSIHATGPADHISIDDN